MFALPDDLSAPPPPNTGGEFKVSPPRQGQSQLHESHVAQPPPPEISDQGKKGVVDQKASRKSRKEKALPVGACSSPDPINESFPLSSITFHPPDLRSFGRRI
ncbi:hypothetical protein RHSIM_Rhsim04G0155100 [Rhododendron simsii]|uniref:Uncharacterized protein n=1 Tax=Rhododendron simsii TaxID=118357 RepID=A0A834H6T0_RHOSS|nr:hypothetical protein RHSIM_Rhsim04G0155100 [Rhododendron simsii]